MKYLKYVLMALIITSCTASMNVFAGIRNYSFDVPGFNGSVRTELREDKLLANREVVRNVVVSPSHDTLDIVMKNEKGGNVGTWKILENGVQVEFDEKYEVMPASAYLYIDSRWNYTKSTYTNFTWQY